MNKIIKIEKKKLAYKVSILIDSEIHNFEITEDLLIESKFLSIREIKDTELKTFLSKIIKDSIILEGYKYLDKNIHSKKETKEHLLQVTSSTTIVDEVVSYLENKGLIDDYSYFLLTSSYLMNEKKDGPLLIEYKLKELGLNYFNFEYPAINLKDNIKSLSIKYDLKNKDYPRNKRIIKCKSYLLSKGYREFDIMNYFKESYMKSYDELNNFKKDFERLNKKYDGDLNKVKSALYKLGYSPKDVMEIDDV